MLVLAACTTTELEAPSAPAVVVAPAAPQSAPPALPMHGRVLGRNERLLVYLPSAGETLASIAAQFLGSPQLAWQVAEANEDIAQPMPGSPLVVPLVEPHPLGVTAEGVQAVVVLCYHRVGPGNSKMTTSTANFEAQLDWLATNGYHVVRLAELAAFLEGKQALPRRSVVITFDDGYASVYRHAYPLLLERGLPATLFIYTDFIGSGDALSWPQMESMRASGLIDIQAHSKTHGNLTLRGADESDAAYRQRLDAEFRLPRVLIERHLDETGAKVDFFAYPYGDANEAVMQAMRRRGYALGLTVTPGGNPFYSAPMLLKRVMIFGDHDLDDFQARVQWRSNRP